MQIKKEFCANIFLYLVEILNLWSDVSLYFCSKAIFKADISGYFQVDNKL